MGCWMGGEEGKEAGERGRKERKRREEAKGRAGVKLAWALWTMNE